MQTDTRRVIVFGGARGIGATVAGHFAEGEDAVTVVARSSDEVHATADRLGATAEVADIADADAVAEVFARAGTPDVVVCAAAVQGGAGAIGPLWETDPAAFAKVVDVNLVGAYNVLREALRAMRPAGRGSVVMFSGGGSVFPRPGFDAYGATKTAVLRLVESAQAALEAEGSEVRVYALAPGAVSTAMTREVLALGDRVPSEAEAAQKIAAGEGVPPTLAAELCAFMATDEAAPLAGRLTHVKEPYRSYVERDLGVDPGRLRRASYPQA